ncbi:MAG TPA: hypothetical protein ENK12_09190 [Gammaproteobacteria bacterium]|nr:hypothetical protein [Gammaproteobacteria bacterium]
MVIIFGLGAGAGAAWAAGAGAGAGLAAGAGAPPQSAGAFFFEPKPVMTQLPNPSVTRWPLASPTNPSVAWPASCEAAPWLRARPRQPMMSADVRVMVVMMILLRRLVVGFQLNAIVDSFAATTSSIGTLSGRMAIHQQGD